MATPRTHRPISRIVPTPRMLADLPFPVRVREELVAQGRAMPHHILSRS